MSDQTRKRMKQLCRRALLIHGDEHQILQAVEELLELADSLMHFRKELHSTRYTPAEKTAMMRDRPDICSEIADVEIMTLQLRELFNQDGSVDRQIQAKLDRLETRLGASLAVVPAGTEEVSHG